MTKQADLPGMENREIRDLQAAAEKLLAFGVAKKRIATKEKEAGEHLIKVMRKHKREHYRYKGLVATITTGADKVTVKEDKVDEEEKQKENEARAEEVKAADALKTSKGKPN